LVHYLLLIMQQAPSNHLGSNQMSSSYPRMIVDNADAL
jgi:hypothetical protein